MRHWEHLAFKSMKQKQHSMLLFLDMLLLRQTKAH